LGRDRFELSHRHSIELKEDSGLSTLLVALHLGFGLLDQAVVP
jgi:hypothetical protein